MQTYEVEFISEYYDRYTGEHPVAVLAEVMDTDESFDAHDLRGVLSTQSVSGLRIKFMRIFDIDHRDITEQVKALKKEYHLLERLVLAKAEDMASIEVLY